MNPSQEYADAIRATYDFAAYRMKDRVADQWITTRFYHNALRALDVYASTLRLVEEELVRSSGEQRMALQNVIRGLHLLSDARYHPCYRDHRIFPLLRQYHEAITLVSDGFEAARDRNKAITLLGDNFLNAVERITSGNYISVVNWKELSPLIGTFYPAVNLDISRLIAGEYIGMYTVKVRAKGSVPHHSHRYLEEHHFLPEPIQGVHQLGEKAARATQPDIIYIPKGQIHAFKNHEDMERTFLFICGSKRTGPWDFIHDITTYPHTDFPPDDHIAAKVDRIGGIELAKPLNQLLTGDMKGSAIVRLSPTEMRLTHSLVMVDGVYQPEDRGSDRLFFVTQGVGHLTIQETTVNLQEGSAFVVLPEVRSQITAMDTMVLHQFEWI
jgi:quercetin dioxygenase-like cupin family protein